MNRPCIRKLRVNRWDARICASKYKKRKLSLHFFGIVSKCMMKGDDASSKWVLIVVVETIVGSVLCGELFLFLFNLLYYII